MNDFTNNPHEASEMLAKHQIEQMEWCFAAEQACKRNAPCFFTLQTAARLLRIDWVPRLPANDSRSCTDLIQVVVPLQDGNPRNRALVSSKRARRNRFPTVYFHCSIPIDTIEIAEQVTCTTPAFTWFLFSAWVSLEDLVKFGDAVLRRTPIETPVTLDDFIGLLAHIRAYASKNHKRAPRGITKCDQALLLMEEGTDSVKETELRLLLERHGMPRPVVNYPLQTSNGGVVFLDIAFPDAKVDVEYDGQHHRSQWEQDAQRRLKIEEAGWLYVQVTNETLATPDGRLRVVSLVARYLKQRTGHDCLLVEPLPLKRVADRRRLGRGRRPIHRDTGSDTI